MAVCIAAMLGLLLIFAWLQQRNVRALAWWGSAYLIGASSIALWAAPSLVYEMPREIPQAMTFVACGMIWNGVRLFHGRPLIPTAAFAGAILWVILCQLPSMPPGSNERIALGAIVVATYTFFIAHELRRERRKSLYSRTAVIVVPLVHATIFLIPLGMQAFLPEAYAASWLTVFTLETMLYAIGTAFIVLMMVKDNDVDIYRSAASTDHLTGLLNRRAFLETAHMLCARQADRRQPVTMMVMDLDHFKSINDRFGHAVGDEVLRVFANVARSSMRGSDLVGRIGGEEFAVIVAEPMEFAERIAERLRASFEMAGITIAEQTIGATVSIGAATAYEPITDIAPLIARADEALYRAKRDGRNRLHKAEEGTAGERARLAAAVRIEPAAKPVMAALKRQVRHAKPTVPA
ncbi:MAG TPA: GGDEF domain-containing protein [Pseudolabrys sp.]|nr:GGDEF domain-containing protein [Pseudolabrys sp.]